MDWVPEIIREGILTALFISGPLVILAAGLGLIVGILQAATQVQEQTLGSAVKVIGIFIALIIGGFYMFSYLKKYTEKNITRAFQLIPSLEQHPMPRKNYFGNVNKKDSKLPGMPEHLDMEKPRPTGPKEPSKIKAKELAAQPDLVKGPARKGVPPLTKPPSQASTEKPNLNSQNMRPAAAPQNTGAQTNPNRPTRASQTQTAPQNNRNTQTTNQQRPAQSSTQRPIQNTRTNTTSSRPKLVPELVETNPTQNSPASAPATPAPTTQERPLSNAIEKLKENAQAQEGAQP